MEKKHQQGSHEWLELRKRFIGASDAPVIMGVSPYKTKRQLWEEKLGLISPMVNTRAIAYGLEMEPEARESYERVTGNIMVPEVVYHQQIPYMMASLDGLSIDRKIAVEIKNVCEADHEIAKLGVIPEKYIPQVQHQLSVLGIDMMHYFSYRKGDFALIEVKRDDKYIDRMCSMEKDFWDLVTNFKEPELSDRDFVVHDSLEWTTAAIEWRSVTTQINALEEREKECRETLVKLSDGHNSIGSGLKLTRTCRKGTVDYTRIQELQGVCVDNYRKDPVISWRFT